MSDPTQDDLPGEAGTKEGETGPSESDPAAPSVEGRPATDEGEEQA